MIICNAMLDLESQSQNVHRYPILSFDPMSPVRMSLLWRHNGLDCVSNHQPHECLLNRSFGHRSKKTSKLRVTGLCVGNSPETGEFPAQMASNAENVSIRWRHHVMRFGEIRWVINNAKIPKRGRWLYWYVIRNSTNMNQHHLFVNSLRAEFFRGNTNIYLHFMSFLHTNKTQVVEISPRVRQGPAYST